MLGPALGFCVGHEGGDGSAGTGRNALKGTNGRANGLGFEEPLAHGPVGQFQAHRTRVTAGPRRLANLNQHFSDCKQAHHDQNGFNTVQ